MKRALIPQVLEPYDYGSSYNPMFNVPESPETAIARRIPHSAIHLLDKESKRRHYNNALAIGSSITNTYLNRLPSEDLPNLIEISIEPEVRKSGFLRICRGKGMVISFRRRK